MAMQRGFRNLFVIIIVNNFMNVEEPPHLGYIEQDFEDEFTAVQEQQAAIPINRTQQQPQEASEFNDSDHDQNDRFQVPLAHRALLPGPPLRRQKLS